MSNKLNEINNDGSDGHEQGDRFLTYKDFLDDFMRYFVSADSMNMNNVPRVEQNGMAYSQNR